MNLPQGLRPLRPLPWHPARSCRQLQPRPAESLISHRACITPLTWITRLPRCFVVVQFCFQLRDLLSLLVAFCSAGISRICKHCIRGAVAGTAGGDDLEIADVPRRPKKHVRSHGFVPAASGQSLPEALHLHAAHVSSHRHARGGPSADLPAPGLGLGCLRPLKVSGMPASKRPVGSACSGIRRRLHLRSGADTRICLARGQLTCLHDKSKCANARQAA